MIWNKQSLFKMKTFFISVLFLLFSSMVRAQDCYCPANGLFSNAGKTIKRFSFGNRESLGLCGYFEVINNDTIYRGITLFQCGHDDPIQDWGEIEECKVTRKADTVFVEELYELPVGKYFSLISESFYIHAFFFDGSEIKENAFYRTDIGKYTPEQIEQVFQIYKTLAKGN